MTSSGPAGSNVRALLQQLCAGEVVDGSAIMLAVARLKDMRARAELVAAAREHAPNLSLTTPSFHILVDLFRVCLREGNNASDFKSVRSVFNLAYQYAMHNGTDTFFVGRLIQSHEAWKNINFWLFCAEELIRYDILRFTCWIQRNPSYPVLPLEEPMFIATVVIIRLQAIVFDSMQAVRVPAEVVLQFVNTAAETYGLSSERGGARVDILRRPVSDFLAWLQDTVIYEMRSDLAQFIAEDIAVAPPLQGHGRHVSKSSDGTGDDWNTSSTSGNLSFDMGFCPLLELLYRLVVKRANASPTMTLDGGKAGTGGQVTAPSGSMVSCVCGRPTGRWKVLGAFSLNKTASSTLSRRMIRHLLCETCYRRLSQTESAPAPVQNVVPMGACAVAMHWPGNLPNNFIAIFYGSGLNEYKAGVASNVSQDNLRSSYVRRIRETLIDRSESGPPRLLSSSAVLKLLASEGKELTSIGIGSSLTSRSYSLSTDGGLARMNSVSSRLSALKDLEEDPNSAPQLQQSRGERPAERRPSKVMMAKDSLRIERNRHMKEGQLQGFISAMQSGVDILKFGHNPIHPLQLRTFFLDKQVSRLCWLSPGK